MEIAEGLDGFLKISIPSLGIVTYAKDLEDVNVAVNEALESFHIMLEKYS